MAASLAALPGNEVLFASEYGRRDFSLPGVKRVLLKKPKDRKKAVASISTPALDAGERDWTMAYLRGRATASSLMGVLAEGFEPDMVILSGSMGNGLFVRNLFPEAFLVGYADWYFRDEAETRYPLSTMPDIPLAPRNIRNTLQAKNFFDCNCHFTTTEWQREQYPEGMRGFISVLRKCVDTRVFLRSGPRQPIQFRGLRTDGTARDRDPFRAGRRPVAGGWFLVRAAVPALGAAGLPCGSYQHGQGGPPR